MKTLVNKANPQIRITAPEFKISGTGRYYIPVKRYCTLTWLPENWTLVEEEPKHTEVWMEGRTIFEQEGEPTEGIKGNLEEIPSNVDLDNKFVFPKFLYARTKNNKTIDVSYAPQSLDAIEYIRGDSLHLEQTDEHPDNFTSFEWLIGRLMFRGCDLWGMTDGEDDNGVVTKLIKDKAVEMMELLDRKLNIFAEPVDLEKAAEEYADKHGFRVPYDGSNNFYDDVDVKASLEGFKAGAKWMAEQMKRDSK